MSDNHIGCLYGISSGLLARVFTWNETALKEIQSCCLIALFLVCLISACCGHYSLDPITCLKIMILEPIGVEGSWSDLDVNVMVGLRLPRIVAAILVGACLAISGASYQSTFQNPLVSPDILGVSSGACVGAAMAILMHLPNLMIMIMAFATGILTVAATVAIPKILRSESNIMLVLSGIVVGGVTGSIMGIIKYVADPLSELPQITYWTMGSLDGLTFPILAFAAVPITICVIILVRMSWWIDIIAMGEQDAKTLGANVKRIRLITITYTREPDQNVIYNTYTKSVIVLNDEEFAQYQAVSMTDPESEKALVENGIFIEDNFDEKDFLRYCHYRTKFAHEVLHLIIAPTMDCNFGCPYCYENRRTGKMTKEVQGGVIAYINKMIGEGVKNLEITWYGGEPLLFPDIVESLSRRIIAIATEHDCVLNMYMVTNGYLLTQELVDLLDELEIMKVQITIDGMKANHDARRHLRSGKGTFDKILENLKLFQDSPIRVDIRMNVSSQSINRCSGVPCKRQ